MRPTDIFIHLTKSKSLVELYHDAVNCFNFKTIQAKIYTDLNKLSSDEIRERGRTNFILHGDNREKLKTLFGPPTFRYRGEFFFHIYAIEMKGKTFFITTAREYGTSYQVQPGIKPEEEQLIIEFMDEIKKILS